jgi:uncharacterized protein (TIGR02466 family)
MQATMTYHAIFPTMVLELQNFDHAPIKSAVEKNFHKWTNDQGFSGESDGTNTVHHDPELEAIYKLATGAARQYVIGLGIDPDRFEYYVMKSWFNIISDGETPVHNHADSHLGFVYYVNIPADKATQIDFHHWEGRHEPYYRMCDLNKPETMNQFNSYIWSVKPSEGTMLMFPGTLKHGVAARVPGACRVSVKDAETYRNCRVAIAGDILLVFRQKTPIDMGIQPMSQWRKFG